MRQVPHYLIIGGGRVARHFQHYLSLLGVSYSTWTRHQNLSSLQEIIRKATHILLLIKDDAIIPFINQHLMACSARRIHFSGSLVTELAIGAHPLMCFSQTLYSLEQYQAITFVIDENAPDYNELLPGIPNPHVRLPTEQKAKYHALCVLSANFSCLLWQKLFNDLENELNIPHTVAFPYLMQQTSNLLESPQSSLTGPLVRNDQKTIQRNLDALASDPFLKVYESFVACYQHIQREGWA